jgi:GT2 family glycosyltransferase
MDIFHGKKALCFIALPHHNRLLVPIMEKLSQRGVEVVFFTAAAEAAFEITLNEAGLPYRHALDYITPQLAEEVSAACRTLRSTWQQLFLAQPVLQAIPIPVQDKIIISAVENLYCFKRMLEVEKPDLLFALHELNPWGKILGYLSHVMRIPYITFQEGLFYTSVPFNRFHTDYSTACVVWGEATKKMLIAAGCGADKIPMLGNIDLWKARDRATHPESVAVTRETLGIKPEQKMVLFFPSHANYKSFEAAPFQRWLKSQPDTVLVFKWHPITNKDVIDRALKHLQGMPRVLSVQEFDTYSLIGACDVCITIGVSTTGMEAFAFDKPLIEIRLPDQNYYSFSAQGVAEPADDFADLAEKVERLLTQGVSPERRQSIERYFTNQFAFFDGQTDERVVEMTATMLQARAHQSPPLPLVSETTTLCSLIVPVGDTPIENVLATLKGIAAHIPSDLFELLLVNAASDEETRACLAALAEDIKVISAEPGESYSACGNRAAQEARGKYLVFLKPGLVPCSGWLEGLLAAAEEADGVGVVSGRVCSDNGLLWQVGIAFDINQSPFPLYRLLPPDFAGATRQREFRAVETPFLVSRALFGELGGFSTDLVNRFEDIDFCLRVQQAGLRVLYTPQATIMRMGESWRPTPQQDQLDCYRFYARWAGSLWQDDGRYVAEDGLDRDGLSALYKQVAAQISASVSKFLATTPAGA